jgi:4-phytase/acid phosphatase
MKARRVKKVWLSILATAAAAISFVALQAQTTQDPTEHLKFVLVLTRHGVRSPTWTNTRLDEYAKQPWPKWEVAPGILTPHGKKLMTQFGIYYRESFASQKLLTATGCSDASKVYIYADTDERTVETGRGIAEGLLPGCPVEVHAQSEGTQDVLFHTAGKLGQPDSQLAFAAVSGRIGDSPSALLPAYQTQLEWMQRILFACPGEPCAAPEGKKDILTVPATISEGKGDHLTELKGPLTTAATFAENVQLEYLEGMPDAQVGWGRVDEAAVRSLMAIHSASSDLVQRTPYIARVQASNLLTHMLQTLEQAEQQKPVAGAIGPPDGRVAFLVGHDTNIANVAALLDAHWLVDGYQRDDAPPGGALVFELWQRPGGADIVRTYYLVQSPSQMRATTPLSLAKPPSKAVVFLPGCSGSGKDSPCTWSNFQRAVGEVIDPDFVQSH